MKTQTNMKNEHKRKQRKQSEELKSSNMPPEILRREPLFKFLGLAAFGSLFVSFLLMLVFSLLILSVKFPRVEWLSFLSDDLKMLAINAVALFLGIFLILSGTALSTYLRPPYSILMTNDRIEFAKWGRSYNVAFDELMGVEQKFRIKRFSFFWLEEYTLYTPRQVIKLPIRYIESHYKVKDRLLQRNEQLNNLRLKELEAMAQSQASLTSLTTNTTNTTNTTSTTGPELVAPAARLILTYSRIKPRQIVVDYQYRQFIFSEKQQLSADRVKKISIDCNVTQKNMGAREIIFQQQDGKSFTIRTKNYACPDEEWFKLLQHLHIVAWKLNIPLEVDIPPNRPLSLFTVNDEKE